MDINKESEVKTQLANLNQDHHDGTSKIVSQRPNFFRKLIGKRALKVNFSTASKSISSRRVSRADGGEGGWLKTLCIKIGFREPRRAESREGSSTVAKSSRVTQYSILIG